MKINPKTAIAVLAGALTASIFWNIYSTNHGAGADLLNSEDRQKIENIRKYVNSISDDFMTDIKTLAKKDNLTSWGCGPSSYALAAIINKKFFDNQLTVHALYDYEPYEITERFGFVQPDNSVDDSIIDHAWIEIYIKNKMLYIDPTVARYQKTKKIVFEEFELGQPDIKKILKEKYGVIDNRLSILLTKIYNNIPVDEAPYNGMTIDTASLPHYQQILKVRNTVSLGREPVKWKDWIDYLTSRYH